MSTNLYFSKTHEWVLVDGNQAKIGISDFAQKELGDIVFLDFNVGVGDNVNANDIVSTIESVKAVSDIYTPLSGKLIEINQIVLDKPETINTSAQIDGWLFKIEMQNKDELNQLLDESSYKNHIAE